jgi:polysaccharide biosynthesis/export protein
VSPIAEALILSDFLYPSTYTKHPSMTFVFLAQTPMPPSYSVGTELPTELPIVAPAQPTRRVLQTDPASYYIGPGDELRITVIGYPEYTGPQTVLSDGTISLPVIGDVMAADLTPVQLMRELAARLNEVLVKPAVNVVVSGQRPITVNVTGSVQRPGPIQLKNLRPSGELNSATTTAGVVSIQRPTVTAALLEAGGVTKEADLRSVSLRRYSPNRSLPPLTINLWEAIASNRPSRDITLQDGDTLFIPKVEVSADIDSKLLSKSSVAPRTVRVKVVGEVKRPGEVAVPPDSTLSSAIAIAGGPTTQARMKEVSFVRRLPNGQLLEKKLDLDKLSDDIQIEDGDVLFVPQTQGDKALDVAGRAAGPLGIILRLFGL